MIAKNLRNMIPFKNSLIIIAVMLISLNHTAQKKIFKEVYHINTKTNPVNPAPEKIISYIDHGIIYYTGAMYHDKQSIKLLTYDINTRKTGSVIIKKTNEDKELFKQEIEDLAVIKNKLIVLNYLSIYIYAKDNNSDYKLKKIIKNNGSFNKIFQLSKDQLLFYVNYQFHPLDETEMHTWAKLYVDSDSLGQEKRMDDNNVVFSPMQNSWISTYKGLIAYAQTTEYTIRIYNDNFELIDSVKTNDLDRNKSKLALIPDGNSHSLDEINRIQQADDSLMTRIQKVFLLDSTHIMLTIKQPQTHHLLFDIWEKQEKAWVRIKSQDLPGHYEEKTKYTSENNFVTGFYGGFTGLTYAGNNEFYFIYFPFIDNPVSDSFDYQKDYYDKVNEMTRKNKLYYGIKKLKISTK